MANGVMGYYMLRKGRMENGKQIIHKREKWVNEIIKKQGLPMYEAQKSDSFIKKKDGMDW